jgi:hypothetical protein
LEIQLFALTSLDLRRRCQLDEIDHHQVRSVA